MKILLPCLLLLSMIASPLAGQYDDSTSRKTLVGLKGIYVLVEHIDDDVARYGLSTQQIQTDVELRLRQAGLVVLNHAQWIGQEGFEGFPYLYVSAQTLKSSRPFFVYHLDLELKQLVTTVRNPSATVAVPTWTARAQLGYVGEEKVPSLRDDIRDMVDQFINAYLAANPKR
jgi:hypothetical protein